VAVLMFGQLLNFYRMAFLLFSLSAFLAAVVLMPLNLFVRALYLVMWSETDEEIETWLDRFRA